MIRRPPRSTLFPTRRSSDLGPPLLRQREASLERTRAVARLSPQDVRPADHGVRQRSEEHTSELQSPCNLVCRLLLEKKKTKRAHIRAAPTAMTLTDLARRTD